MKRIALLILIPAVLLVGCDTKKATDKATSSASSVVEKAKGTSVCAVVGELAKNYKNANDATKDSDARDIAANQFRNALEAMKSLVPDDVREAISQLRESDAPLDPSQYTPSQAQARQKIDAYLKNTCGSSF